MLSVILEIVFGIITVLFIFVAIILIPWRR